MSSRPVIQATSHQVAESRRAQRHAGPAPQTRESIVPKYPRVFEEWFLVISTGTALLFAAFGDRLQSGLADPWWLAVILFWLFASVLGSALAVARHADRLALRLGEPYGTLLTTLSVTAIEVAAISAVMLHGQNNPHLVSHTLFSVTMITLNGVMGAALILGGWRHREQQYNLQGANAYLGMLIPLAILTLALPATQTGHGAISYLQKVFLAIMAGGIYVTFLVMQTTRHQRFFTEVAADISVRADHGAQTSSTAYHFYFLAAYLIPVLFLSRELAKPVDYLIETLHAPVALGGMLIALLVAAPEAVGAIRAALRNHMQRAVNILLGSVLSTIGLTVPLMIIASYVTGRDIILTLTSTDDRTMLFLTLAVSVVTFSNGRTNIMQGLVYLLLFGTYLLLIF